MPNLDSFYAPDNRIQAFERHEHGLLVSIAGPGTGKTHSLLKRAAALGSAGVPFDAICYLTFIKGIADEFVEDYIEEFGAEHYAAQRPRISTLHSFACRLIRNLGYQIGFDGELFFDNIADKHTDTSDTILKDLLPYLYGSNCTTIPQLRSHLSRVKQAWQDTTDPNALPDPIPTILPITLDLLRAFRVLDWDQTVLIASDLLNRANPIPEWIRQISHYFIDEFQDFNKAEQALILLLSNLATSTVIVGDDDQSLFSGRGGSPNGIRALYSNPSHDQVSLIKCFRCRENIVQAANRFQAFMRPGARPMLPYKDNGSIISYRFKSTKTEFAFLANLLASYVAQMPDPPKPKQGAVCLFPIGKQLDFYFSNLSPIVPCLKRKFQPSPERLWLERVLHLIHRPGQRFLQRLLLNRLEAVKPRHRHIIVHRVLERDCDLALAIDSLLADGTLTDGAADQCRLFCDFLNSVAAQEVAFIAGYLVRMLPLDQAQVTAGLESFLQQIDLPEIDDLVTKLSDNIYPQSAQPPEDPKSILFLTMHASKGLTRKNVVLPGLEAAWLPSQDSSQDLAEKQRLFYVAITRATDSVIITYPLNRSRGDPMNYDIPGRGKVSPFVTASGITDVYHG
jgi:DNA helicase-2/ATP-dependent DNA helicase PcrA